MTWLANLRQSLRALVRKEKVETELGGERLIETFVRDLRYGFRTLGKRPGFSFVIVLTLALGIGANSAIFSLLNGVVLQPLPYRDDNQLVLLRQSAPKADIENVAFSVREIHDYRRLTRSFDQIVEYHSMSFTLIGRGEPDRVRTGVVSANFFDVLGVRPLQGRTFVEGDDDLGAEAVLVLSHPYWQQRFGGDPDIVGQVFEMNDRPHTVVGVLPPIPQYPRENDVYMPTSACPFRARAEERMEENRGAGRMMSVFGRLKPTASLEASRAELARVAASFRQDHPETYPEKFGFAATSIPLHWELTQQARPVLYILLGITALVLVIACANVANLMLSFVMRRDRELALRAALGASRGRLLRQLLTESLLLALAGGGLGLLLARGGLDLLVSFVSRFTTRTAEIAIDGWVLLFTLGISVLTGLVFGALPVLWSRIELVSSLKEGSGQSTESGGRLRLRSALIVAQVAVSFVLLVGAGLMVRSLIRLARVDPGFSIENVLTAEVPLNWTRYDSAEKRHEFWERLLDQVRSFPGVLSAAVVNGLPLTRLGPRNVRFEIEGRPVDDNDLKPQLDLQAISSGYFETVRIPVLRGRSFAESDDAQAPRLAIVSSTMARHFWPHEDPLGQRVAIGNNPEREWMTIVGVVGDVREYGLDSEPTDKLYLPYRQGGFAGRVVVRTLTDPSALAREIREAVYRLDAQQPIENVTTLAQLRRHSMATPRTTTFLVGLFSALALLITVTGLGGVIAFAVNQRTHEFGVRLALGASRSSVLGIVLRQGLGLVVAGLVLGAVGAAVLSRFLEQFLFAIEPTDPLTYAGTALALVLATTVACLMPARRATSIDPISSLRSE